MKGVPVNRDAQMWEDHFRKMSGCVTLVSPLAQSVSMAKAAIKRKNSSTNVSSCKRRRRNNTSKKAVKKPAKKVVKKPAKKAVKKPAKIVARR